MSALRTPAVIFDLDGTLVDSEPNYFEAGRRLLARYGVEDFTWEDHEPFIGIGTRETLEVLRDTYGVEEPVDVLLAGMNDLYLDIAAADTAVFPAIGAFARRLHADGHPLAVASGSSRAAIEAVLDGCGLDGLFTAYVSAEEVAHGKPAPDVFLEAADRLGVAPRRCVVLEDSPPGVEAARRAVMRCIAVPSPPTAGDAGFASAGLVFPSGPGGFDADAALEWMRLPR